MTTQSEHRTFKRPRQGSGLGPGPARGGLKSLDLAPQSPFVPPTCVCPLLRGLLRGPRYGSDRPLRGDEFEAADAADGSIALFQSFEQRPLDSFFASAGIADARTSASEISARRARRYATSAVPWNQSFRLSRYERMNGCSWPYRDLHKRPLFQKHDSPRRVSARLFGKPPAARAGGRSAGVSRT